MCDLIFLIGYRGVGKTTIGRHLAQSLNWAFVDTDDLIVRRQETTITAIVEEGGWQEFRRLEQKVLNSLAGSRRKVVATGGGAVLHRQVWQHLRRRGTVFWLTAATEIILHRLGADPVTGTQRPPLAGRSPGEELAAVLEKRLPLYEKTAHYRIDTSSLSEDAVVKRLRDILAREHAIDRKSSL